MASYGLQPKDPRYEETRGYLGLSLAGQRRYVEALPLIEAAVQYYGTSRSQLPYFRRLVAAQGQCRDSIAAGK